MQFYEHSGRCGPIGVPLAAIIGLVTGLVFGLIYSYVLAWIPLIYASFLATGGFGFIVGAAVAWGAKLGKIRNTGLTAALAAFVAMVAVYFAWVFDPMARGLIEEIDFPVWSPVILWEYIKLGYENGFWTIGRGGDAAVSGMFLATVWIVEAAAIIGIAYLTVNVMHADLPYCEETDQWTKREKKVAQLSLVDDSQAEAKINRLLSGEIDSLSEFYHAGNDDPATLQLDLATCPDCPTCNYLTVKMIRLVTNKKGEKSKEEDDLLVNLQVTSEDVARIRAAGVDRPPAPVGADETSDPEAAT